MRPWLNELLLSAFDSPWILYLVPSGPTIYFVGLGVTTWLFVRRCRGSGLRAADATGGALLAVVGGLAGARIYYLVHHWDDVRRHGELITACTGGLASWGGYAGGLLALVLYLRFRGQDVMRYLDVLASAAGAGPFLIRWACFLNGCCHGTPIALPWAVTYPPHSFACRSQLEAGLLPGLDVPSLPVHPVQVYLSFLGLVTLVAATLFWRRFAECRGATFLFFWFVYGSGRFLLEFLRGDVPRYGALALTLSHGVALLVLGAVLASLRLLVSRRPVDAARRSA